MSQDSFYRKIIDSLCQELNGTTFESCAADLLRTFYPTLVPIPGGNDAGMDGAIADGKGTALPLICTTSEDVIGNLRSSLQSYKKQGGERRDAVLATSRKLSPKQRRNLETTAKTENFTLIQVHEQRAMANLLRHSPRWCNELLGLSGNAPALAALPCTERPFFQIPLIGRDEDLKWLQDSVDDLLVVGQPGSGKTFLLQSLVEESGGLFVCTENIDAIASALREQSPKILLIDDVHVKRDLLTKLRHLRQTSNGKFRIVADCWPDETQVVAAAMNISRKSIRDLQLLTRDEMVKVLNAVGIYGPTQLLKELVDQALGKPGLAVTLANLCLQHDIHEVALGTALAQDIRRSFEPIVGHEAIRVLAAFAVGGDAGMSYQTVAEELRHSLTFVSDVVTRLAAGGIITAESQRLTVWPETLRHALVRDAFFNCVAPLPFHSLADKAPNMVDVTSTLIGARARGANFPDHLITDFLKHISIDSAWKEYSSLGKDESEWVLRNHPGQLIPIARQALYHTPSLALPMLLDKAVGDPRELHNHTDQPLRLIQDWIGAAQPGTPEALERRKVLLNVAIQWLQVGKDTHIGLRAIELAMSPNYSDIETDPGSGMTITLRHGYITQSQVCELKKLWAHVAASLKDVPIENWAPLKSAVHNLAHPHALNTKLTEDHRKKMEELATQVIMDIVEWASNRPGVLAWAQEFSRRLKKDIFVEIPQDYLILFPNDDHSSKVDWSARLENQAEAARELGRRWVGNDAGSVCQRIVCLEREAAMAGERTSNGAVFACQEIARLTDHPLQWINQLIHYRARPELLGPFFYQMLKKQHDGLVEIISICLADNSYKLLGIEAVLAMEEAPPELLEKVLAELPTIPDQVNQWCLLGRIEQRHLPCLLNHPSNEVASAAAVGMFHAREPITDGLKQLWRKAIVRLVAKSENLYGIFDNDPDLAFEWLRNRIANPEYLIGEEYIFECAINALPAHHRMRLIDCLNHNYYPHDFLNRLIGDDVDVYRHLLSRPHLSRVQLVPLEGPFTSAWPEKAIAALNLGHSAEELANDLISQSRSWSGSEAEMWKEWANNFDPFLKHSDFRLQNVAEQCIEWANQRRECACKREREEAVYGRR